MRGCGQAAPGRSSDPGQRLHPTSRSQARRSLRPVFDHSGHHLRLAEAHQSRGHDTSIFALWGGGPLAEEALHRGVSVAVSRGNRLRGAAGAAARLAWIRPDVIHAHNPDTMHYAALGALVSGARLVVTEHNVPDVNSRTPRWPERALCSAVVCVSQATARATLAAASERDAMVVHNGVMPQRAVRPRDQVRADLGLGPEPVAVHVARFDRRKAHDVVVRALGRLRDDGVALTTILVGEGREHDRVRQLAAALALGQDRVRFLGERSDVIDLLAASDIFLLPSMTEGVSLALLEAMTQSLPVVVSAVDGNLEVVRDGEDGLHVPAGDDAALAMAVARLARDPALRSRLGEAASRRARDAFSFDVMASRYEDIYHRALAAPLGRRVR